MSDDLHYFNDSDIRMGERVYNWKERTAYAPDDFAEDIILTSYGLNGINISLSGKSSLSRAEKLLAGIPDGLEKALRSTVSRMGTRLKTSSTKAASERYAVDKSTIRKEENVSVTYSLSQGAQVSILFSGEKIPLYRFSGANPKGPTKDMSRRVGIMFGSSWDMGAKDYAFKWRLVHPAIPAKGHALKSTSPFQFQNAFVAHFRRTGHTGIFERTGGMTSRDKDEIQELYGPSVPQMLGNDEVANKVIDDTMEHFDKRMEHEISRILNGYGG